MPRDLPSNITVPSFDAYQVRIVRDEREYSATFAWSRYGSQERALSEAVAWRDALLAKLPPAATTLGSYRATPQKNKHSYNRVGISRYIGVDRRKLGAPGYLRFAVNWVDDTEHSRVTSFQVGKVGAFTWEDELHAACTAEAFRTHWEFSRAAGQPFDPSCYEGWRKKRVIGFTCCFRQSAALKHIGISFGFKCCYNERSLTAGEAFMEIQKRVKAYIVETDDPEEATVQFATTNVAARRQGADTIGTDFGYVSCKRLPWADLYAEDRVIPEPAFIANGWRYECATCGDSVDSYTESPVFALNLVFCCEACHDAEVEDRKAEAARKQELIDAVQAKYPGAVVTYASGHETRRNVSFRFPGGQGPVDWELGSETALIYRDDLNAWNAWHGLQPAHGGDLCAEGAAGD